MESTVSNTQPTRTVEVVEEVKAFCANLPSEPEPTEGEPEPTAEPTEGEPEPTAEPTEGEPEPTEGEPEPTPTEGGKFPVPPLDATPANGGEDPAEPAEPTDGGDYEGGDGGNGTAPIDPPTAGARALAPMGALLVGLFAFAL